MLRRFFCKIALITAVVCALLAFSGVLFAQGRSEDGLARAIEAQEKHTERLMAINGVVGTAVGFNLDGHHAVLVLLENGGVVGIPQELEGIPFYSVVTGQIHAFPKPEGRPGKPPKPDPEPEPEPEPEPQLCLDPWKWCRPVPIGVSTGHPAITAGTIGCRVKDSAGNVYALSNNHVYANSNDAQIGDSALQPGPYDGGTEDDAIGTLADFEPIRFDGSNNTYDAAIAKTSTEKLLRTTPNDGYGVPKSATARARLLQGVKKYGRTTGLTDGYVAGLNATIDVCYDNECTIVARFTKQIVIGPAGFSGPGDSGSLIVCSGGKDDLKPVGLLFAGGGGWTFANPIGAVLDRFGVAIDGN